MKCECPHLDPLDLATALRINSTGAVAGFKHLDNSGKVHWCHLAIPNYTSHRC